MACPVDQLWIPSAIILICSSVSIPPTALESPGIIVPCTPSAMIFRIVSFGTTARYTGLFIEIEAPNVLSLPWQATQFVLYRSAKFLFASGGFHLSSSFGFPGNWSQPHSAANPTKRRHQFKICCCMRLFGYFSFFLSIAWTSSLWASGQLCIVSTFWDLNTTKPPTTPNDTWQIKNQSQSTRAASAGVTRFSVG